ncbi:MAG TPA: WecB/TagA/CpsF family glycosyltransferase [Bacteroidales bacterium]|nr:WecB/TagA/CpsF family glycosyltransferase [Bacteroidales bacterium]
MDKTNFFTLRLDVFSFEGAMQKIESILKNQQTRLLFFINAHCFNIAQKNQSYKKSLLEADLVFNDGVGIDLAARIGGVKLKANLNGTDLIPAIIELAGKINKNIYLLGGKPGIADKAKIQVEKKFPVLQIKGVHSGYFDEKEENRIIEEINLLNIDLLVVGMGVPRQELWLLRNKDKFNNLKLGVAGGAIIDFLSGNISRAPVWMRRSKIEWIYRLWLEPRRMWQRYMIGNIVFFWHILRLKKEHKLNQKK